MTSPGVCVERERRRADVMAVTICGRLTFTARCHAVARYCYGKLSVRLSVRDVEVS